jgi:hypothetical protein
MTNNGSFTLTQPYTNSVRAFAKAAGYSNSVISTSAVFTVVYGTGGGGGISTSVVAVADAYVALYYDGYETYYYGDDNFGSADYLYAGVDGSAYPEESFYKSYVRFAVSNYVPAGQVVTQAILQVYGGRSLILNQDINVCQVTTNWGEYTITWNNAPAGGGSLGSISPPYPNPSNATCDVTGYVNSNRTSAQIGFLLDRASDGIPNLWSRESSSNRPTLIIRTGP